MKEIDLKNLSLRDHMALFNKSVFALVSIILLTVLLFLNCKSIRDTYRTNISLFKQGKNLIRKNSIINKNRGWTITKANTKFVKGDKFFYVINCQGEEQWEEKPNTN